MGIAEPLMPEAQGTVFGNGVGLVVLKRLQDALADGDCIQAVIKGSAINNDGVFESWLYGAQRGWSGQGDCQSASDG